MNMNYQPFNNATQNYFIPETQKPNRHFTYFAECLSRFQNMDINKFYGLEKYWSIKILSKNESLFKKDEKFDSFYVIKGAIKGITTYKEKKMVTSFLTEGCFVENNNHHMDASGMACQAICVEPTIIVTINRRNKSRLIHDCPVFSSFFSKQKDYVLNHLQNRLLTNTVLSARERYEECLNQFPDLTNRFCLKDIASYLGIKPETVSRIRGNSLKKSN